MRSILITLFIFICSVAHAQYFALQYNITFDSGSIYKASYWTGPVYYYSYSSLIDIDTVHYKQNKWQIGHPGKVVFDSASSLPNAIVTDTLLPCLPNDTSVFTLKVPKSAWLGLRQFTFDYNLDIDTGDVAMVEVSADTGLHWTNVTDSGTGINFGYMVPKLDLRKSTGGWRKVDMFLGYGLPYSPADTFLFRFTFITDTSTKPRDGWMMDNFIFGYDGEGIESISNNASLSIHPNPATSQIAITSAAIIDVITITDVMGREVLKNKFADKHVVVNVGTLPAGAYYVRINGSGIRRFVKQ